MSASDPDPRTIRHAAHDAVRAVLAAPVDSLEGSAALRAVVGWPAAEHCVDAVRDLTEELAVDLAEALDSIAAAEPRPALDVVDGWFHDAPVPNAGDER